MIEREKKLYDQDISYYLCKVFTLKFILYSEYYVLQEKGLKMKGKKKIMRLMIGTRWKKYNQKGFRVKKEKKKKRKKKKNEEKKEDEAIGDTKRRSQSYSEIKKIGKRGPFNIIKETLQDCGLFGLENLRDWKHFKIGWKTSILAAVDRVTSKVWWKGW